MKNRAIAIGVSVIAAITTSQAEERGARVAVVDGAGRVILTAPNAVAVNRIDETRTQSPCGSIAPLPVEEARALVTKIATQENFYPEFVFSVAKSESRFDSNALSDKGAFGLMQLTPETARSFKVDLCDPAANVLGGVRFLRALHAKYRNPLFILAAYNAGEEAVEKAKGVPPFPETARFVAQVVNDFYAWPAADGSPPRERGAKAEASALIEPATRGGAAPSAADQPANERWNSGFVMHID